MKEVGKGLVQNALTPDEDTTQLGKERKLDDADSDDNDHVERKKQSVLKTRLCSSFGFQ